MKEFIPLINQRHWCSVSRSFPKNRVKSFAVSARIVYVPVHPKGVNLQLTKISRELAFHVYTMMVVVSSSPPASLAPSFSKVALHYSSLYIRACSSKGATCCARFEWNARKGHPFILRLRVTRMYSHTR